MQHNRFLQMLCMSLIAFLSVSDSLHAARSFNGTSQEAHSASTLTLSSYDKMVIAFWVNWNTFVTNDDIVLNYGFQGGNTTIRVNLNSGAGGGSAGAAIVDASGNTTERTWPWATADTWQLYVININANTGGSPQIPDVWIDGNGQSLNTVSASGTAHTFANNTLYLMSYGGASLFADGQIAEVAIWAGINFTETDGDALWNGGSGTAATNIQSGALVYYWKLCGNASPEPGATGGVDMTLVNSPPQTTHPFTNGCTSTAAPLRRRISIE